MSAQHLFNAIFNASLAVMILALVTGLGLSLTLHQILAPLRRVWVLVATVIANSVLAPLVAIGVSHALPLSTQSRVGVELAAMAAAGPVGMKAAELTKRADMAMAVSFTIVLQVLNIAVAPLFAKQIVTGATVDPWSIVKDLLLLVLAPLVIGQILRARHPEHAEGWQPGLEKISNVALLVAIAVGIAVNWKLLVHAIGSWVLVASAVIVVVCMLLGWLAGRVGDPNSAMTISMVSGMRFTPIGLIVIATTLHNEGAYLIPALLFSLAATVIPIVAGLEVGRATAKVGKKQTAEAPPAAAAGTPSGAAG
ncbi:MAG TPA: bile acid:sodium symporter [Gaiellaceae bacterium]|nr:bile acid:sodium symporter [Gaiellaceae bacterium]